VPAPLGTENGTERLRLIAGESGAQCWTHQRESGLRSAALAHPGHALEEVAYALEYRAPFRSDDDAVRLLGFDRPPDRRRRVRLFAEAYGLADPSGLVDLVIARQRLTIRHVRELADAGVERQRRWVREGYLAELVRRVRWSQTHRHLFQ
jgi:hypothetical protein